MNRNGHVKRTKPKRQRVVITITERPDAKFNANIVFEPAARDRKSGKYLTTPQNEATILAGLTCWEHLQKSLKGRIILTDDL